MSVRYGSTPESIRCDYALINLIDGLLISSNSSKKLAYVPVVPWNQAA